jgi:ketosteroid isomerase-like protein
VPIADARRLGDGESQEDSPMSNVTRNIETVRKIYEAFSRGDVPAIVERLSDDVSWEFGGSVQDIPWLEPGRGRQHAARFFGTLQGFDFNKFEILSVMGDGDWVVGLAEVDLTWRATGTHVREACEPHVWKFDAAGRVIAFRHAADTHQHWLAAKG